MGWFGGGGDKRRYLVVGEDTRKLLECVVMVEGLREAAKSLSRMTGAWAKSLSRVTGAGGTGGKKKKKGSAGGALCASLRELGGKDYENVAIQPSEDALADLRYVLKRLSQAQGQAHNHICIMTGKVATQWEEIAEGVEKGYYKTVRPLKIEYRTPKKKWMDLEEKGGGGGGGGEEKRRLELKWKEVSSRYEQGMRDFLEEHGPAITEGVRKMAAMETQAFGMAAGELQPPDKSLHPQLAEKKKKGVGGLMAAVTGKINSPSLSKGKKDGGGGGGGGGEKEAGVSSTTSSPIITHYTQVTKNGDFSSSSSSSSDGIQWGGPLPDTNPFDDNPFQ